MNTAWTADNPRRRTPAERPPAAIILAADQADGHDYAERHGHTRYLVITPRSIAQARGRIGPVYATRRARTHHRYAEMRAVAAACGATLPRKSRDRRIA